MGDGRISVDLGGNLEGIWVESEDGFGLASNPAQSGAWRASNDVIYGFRQPRIVIYRRDGDVRRRVSFWWFWGREVGGARGWSVRSKVKHFPGTFLRVWRGNDVIRVYTEFGDD